MRRLAPVVEPVAAVTAVDRDVVYPMAGAVLTEGRLAVMLMCTSNLNDRRFPAARIVSWFSE